jgi:hypothetical protein
MNRSVGQEKEVGLALAPLSEPLDRVVREFVGDVALLRNAFPVDAEPIPRGQVGALPSEADPAVLPGWGSSLSPPMCHLPIKTPAESRARRTDGRQ